MKFPLRSSIATVAIILLFIGYKAEDIDGWYFGNDNYRYTRMSLQILGMSRKEAQLESRDIFCRQQISRGSSRCAEWTPQGLRPDHPRYEWIFETRPGYPLLAAPFIAAFGVLEGQWILGLLLAAAGSLLTFRLLRRAGLGRCVSAFGQAVFLFGGLGYWATQPGYEGLIAVCALGCVSGALRILQGHTRTGLVRLLPGLAVMALTLCSSALALSVLLTATALVHRYATRKSGTGQRASLLLAGVAAGVAAVLGTVIALLGLPGIESTMQDRLTHHFARPDVADPVAGMLKVEAEYWPLWVQQYGAFVPVLAISCWMLWRRRPTLAVPACAIACTGLCAAVAMPKIAELDRIWVLMWMPVVLGLPFLAEALRSRICAHHGPALRSLTRPRRTGAGSETHRRRSRIPRA
ncbi:hypothetical protein [Streptomyces camelliae]|uniref:Integral membrane protein n=1 Tax=Streptomyces camelliae TaxID=3004093 RepID=A0ABY7P5V3_9ACTN|nr:hypothetical protein [Streptomyces sp. HUAS 2-6]WBO64909.1 hypothetical protein O1G22_19755 [Streptomyces sp. HUAS 2-6]